MTDPIYGKPSFINANYFTQLKDQPVKSQEKARPQEPEDVIMTDAWVDEQKPTHKIIVERRQSVFPHNLDSFIAQIKKENK